MNVDFSAFKDEYVMGVNLLALDTRFKELNAEFYCYSVKWDASWAKHCCFALHEIYEAVNENVKLFLSASSHYWINNFDCFGILEAREKFQNNIYFLSDNTFIPDGQSTVCCGLKGDKAGVLPRSINLAIDLGFTDIFLVGSDYNKDPQRIGHFYGSTDFISENRTQNEEEINLEIRVFAEKSGVKIFNVIERNQTSYGFDGVYLDDIYEICNSNSK